MLMRLILVVVILASMSIDSRPQICSMHRSCKNRRSFTCKAVGSSSISPKKSVPLSADLMRPLRGVWASVCQFLTRQFLESTLREQCEYNASMKKKDARTRDTGTSTQISDSVKEGGVQVCGDCHDHWSPPEHRVILVDGL